MDQRRKKLRNRLSRTIRRSDYIPVVETTHGSYMIWGNKYSEISRRVSYNYDRYIESKGTSKEEEKFKELKEKVKIAVELKIGEWKDLKDFLNEQNEEGIKFIEESIEIYGQ